jgi:ectoine hydroxylase-related dioxygenase (phytanoyl-CoA dioxygenase family)
MEREPRPLQTITSHKGSQQALHSDSIHMTTYPLGYLTAAWIAFENIHPESGPLVYYPGSHKLPYVFSKDAGISESDYKANGYAAYQQKYEPYISELVREHGLRPAYFYARKGDVLIWHANLVHGGSQRINLRLSRRALVCHFFVKGSFVYHDLAAARSRQQYMGTCLLRDEAGRINLPAALHRGHTRAC